MRPEITAMVKTMMPSYWKVYRSSVVASTVSFLRVLFTYTLVSKEGDRVVHVGMLNSLGSNILTSVNCAIKSVINLVLTLVAVTLFVASPFINLVMLPFYRRKSFKEVVKYANAKQDELDEIKRQIDEKLGEV